MSIDLSVKELEFLYHLVEPDGTKEISELRQKLRLAIINEGEQSNEA